MPTGVTGTFSFGILNFIIASIFVSFLAMLISSFISIGGAIFITFVASKKLNHILTSSINLLAGIPSVIYGFIGLNVIVKIFFKIGIHTGNCVIAAIIVLSIMLIPYMISSISDSLTIEKEKYFLPGIALGINKWNVITHIILPTSFKYIFSSMILAVGRAMGETMAVMMVIGNANLFPTLLGKSETIACLIALELGGAVYGSTHYAALYAAAFVLMLVLIVINLVMIKLKDYFFKMERKN